MYQELYYSEDDEDQNTLLREKLRLAEEKQKQMSLVIKKLRNENAYQKKLLNRAKESGFSFYKFKQGNSQYIRRREKKRLEEQVHEIASQAKEKAIEKHFVNVLYTECKEKLIQRNFQSTYLR